MMKTLTLPTQEEQRKFADLRHAFDSTLVRLGAKGYNTEGDVLTQTSDGRPLNRIWDEYRRTIAMFNAGRDPLVALLTFNVTDPIEDVFLVTGDDFEEASEFGEPKGIRTTGEYHSMGYDFKWYDVAIRYTWKFLAEATAPQVDALNQAAMEADNRLVFKKVMRTVFNNVTRAADIRGQNYNVYPFYNGDAIVPPSFKTYTHTSGHNHFLVSGAAVVDHQDLIDMETQLKQHGYGAGQGGARHLLLCNPQEVATISTFRVANGARYDFIPAQGSPATLESRDTIILGGGQPANTFAGLAVAGRYGNWLIIEEDYIPAGYMFGFATGGTMQAGNPVGIREHANPGLRGLRLIKGRDNDYPLIDSFYQHGLGTGVRHRGAGVVMQVKASGSYTIPTEYV